MPFSAWSLLLSFPKLMIPSQFTLHSKTMVFLHPNRHKSNETILCFNKKSIGQRNCIYLLYLLFSCLLKSWHKKPPFWFYAATTSFVHTLTLLYSTFYSFIIWFLIKESHLVRFFTCEVGLS